MSTSGVAHGVATILLICMAAELAVVLRETFHALRKNNPIIATRYTHDEVRGGFILNVANLIAVIAVIVLIYL